jgi:hypothetical protein
MKAMKSIDFYEVCRILKQLDIKIEAVRQAAETDQSNSQLNNQDSSATSKTTTKRENAINLNALSLHLNVTRLNEIHNVKSTSQKNSSD